MSEIVRADGGDRTRADDRFVCPECGQDISVNAEMRSAILANGCPVCTAVVTPEDFEHE